MRIVKMLLHGNTYGLPGSDGKLRKWGNFREWAKNQHPVLSMFFAHELHPFSRSERFSVLLCYLSWAFFITCVFEQQMNHDNQEICDEGCDNAYTDGGTQKVCGSGSGENSHVVFFNDYNSACEGVLPWYLLSFTIAACTVPYSTVLKVLATCGCVQALPHCVKSCFEFLGALMLSFFGCLSFIWLGVGISISLTLDGGMFMAVYGIGVAKSWMYWPLIAGVVFLWKYKGAKRRFEEEHPGQVAMAWPLDEASDHEIKIDRDGKPIAYQSPSGSPRVGAERAHRAAGATAQFGSPNMTPEPTPSPHQFASRGGFWTPPGQYQQHYTPTSPTYRYPTAPPPEDPEFTVQACGGRKGISPPVSYRDIGGSPEHRPPGSEDDHSSIPPRGYENRRTRNIEEGRTLPPGWEAQVLPGGRIMFVDHSTQTTHWDPPIMIHQQLPPSPPSYQEHQTSRGHHQPQQYQASQVAYTPSQPYPPVRYSNNSP
ncbi:unnamed protein product [Scytosiphon promiscuus]